MGKTIISALVFVLMVSGVVLVLKKIPQVQEYSECYKKAHEVYTQKGVIAKRAYTKEEDICKKNKAFILQGAQCFYRVDNQLEVLESERSMLKTIAKSINRASKEMDEIVIDHNESCDYKTALILPHELEELRLRYEGL